MTVLEEILEDKDKEIDNLKNLCGHLKKQVNALKTTLRAYDEHESKCVRIYLDQNNTIDFITSSYEEIMPLGYELVGKKISNVIQSNFFSHYDLITNYSLTNGDKKATLKGITSIDFKGVSENVFVNLVLLYDDSGYSGSIITLLKPLSLTGDEKSLDTFADCVVSSRSDSFVTLSLADYNAHKNYSAFFNDVEEVINKKVPVHLDFSASNGFCSKDSDRLYDICKNSKYVFFYNCSDKVKKMLTNSGFVKEYLKDK